MTFLNSLRELLDLTYCQLGTCIIDGIAKLLIVWN